MSCYLNFGIVSIFRLVHEVKLAQAAKVSGASKFEEEIVKWREVSPIIVKNTHFCNASCLF